MREALNLQEISRNMMWRKVTGMDTLLLFIEKPAFKYRTHTNPTVSQKGKKQVMVKEMMKPLYLWIFKCGILVLF